MVSDHQPQPGVMHEVDAAFYRLTVNQRDAAWREIAALRAVLTQIADMDDTEVQTQARVIARVNARSGLGDER